MLYPLSYAGIAGTVRIELTSPESRSGTLTIVLSAASCDGENRTLIARVSDGLPAIGIRHSAIPGTRTRTPPQEDYFLISNQVPYQLGLEPQICHSTRGSNKHSRDIRNRTGNLPRIRRMLYQLRYVPQTISIFF